VIRFIPMRDLCQSEVQSKFLHATANFVLKQKYVFIIFVYMLRPRNQ